MWQYVREQPLDNINADIITRKYIHLMMEEFYEGYFSDTSIYYLRELMHPFIVQINTIQSTEELIAFNTNVPYNEYFNEDNRNPTKKKSMNLILNHLLIDPENDNHRQGITNTVIITPWSIYDYINEREELREFFQPPQVSVNVIGYADRMAINKLQLLGIMAVYRYLHILHPFSMYGLPLDDEVDEVNKMALSEYKSDDPNSYHVNVGTDVYAFNDISFFQGLLTGAQWNRLDPHDFITNLIQWKKIPIPENYPLISTVRIREGVYETINPHRHFPDRYTINLDY